MRRAVVVQPPPMGPAALVHQPVAGQPRPAGAVAWVHQVAAGQHPAGAAASAPQAVVVQPRLAVEVASAGQLQVEAAVSAPLVEAAAWVRQAASVGHQRREAWADQLQAASADPQPPEAWVGHRPRAEADRRQAGADRAWLSPPPDPGRPHPGTAPTVTSRATRASAAPLPLRLAPREQAPALVFPRSTPGTRRRNRRTRPFPCCGSRRTCRRSRSVHLHSVHDVRRLGGRYRRVDQIHGYARRVVHPDAHGQPW